MYLRYVVLYDSRRICTLYVYTKYAWSSNEVMKYLHEFLSMYHNIYKSTTCTPHHHLPSSIFDYSATLLVSIPLPDMCVSSPNLTRTFLWRVPPVERLPRDKYFFYKYISSKMHNVPSKCFSKYFCVWYLAISFENMILKFITM